MKFSIINSKQIWNKTVESFEKNDVYFKYGYFVPFSNYGDGEPNLFYYESDFGRVAYPYMLRDIADCPNLKGKIEKGIYFDISSAYGYGGPLYETDNLPELKSEFFEIFSKYCSEKNIISQFDRFHPILKNHILLDGYSELAQIRKTVHIDLTDSDTIWKNIIPKCRNMIRKSLKSDVKIVFDHNFDNLKDFIVLYQNTMTRNETGKYYHLNEEFFKETKHDLNGSTLLVHAYYQDKIIASSLFLKNEKYLHYHFSGSDYDYRHLQPNNLLLYEVAEYGCRNGLSLLHLGGGFESAEDSLYRFKKSFNRNDPNNFYIGKKIHDETIYLKLLKLSSKDKTDNTYFPKYRI